MIQSSKATAHASMLKSESYSHLRTDTRHNRQISETELAGMVLVLEEMQKLDMGREAK